MMIAAIIFGVIGLTFGTFCAVQLYRWEKQLRGARIVIAFKGKTKLGARLVDWLKWANSLSTDKDKNGQVVYRMGGTTVAIIKPSPRSHGQTETKIVSEKRDVKVGS